MNKDCINNNNEYDNNNNNDQNLSSKYLEIIVPKYYSHKCLG